MLLITPHPRFLCVLCGPTLRTTTGLYRGARQDRQGKPCVASELVSDVIVFAMPFVAIVPEAPTSETSLRHHRIAASPSARHQRTPGALSARHSATGRPACGIAEPPQALAGGTDGLRRPSSRRYSNPSFSATSASSAVMGCPQAVSIAERAELRGEGCGADGRRSRSHHEPMEYCSVPLLSLRPLRPLR